MTIVILLRLLFAHVLSDFVFQSDKICEGKQEKASTKYVYQLLHSFIHALTAYLFVWDWSNWIIPLVIFVSHTLMDYIKVEFMKKDVASFVTDQLVHIIIIILLWSVLFDYYCCPIKNGSGIKAWLNRRINAVELTFSYNQAPLIEQRRLWRAVRDFRK